MIVFRKRGSKLNWKWNVRLNVYKLTLSDVIKYLGIYLDKFLNGHYQLQQVMHKLGRAVGMLSKVRYYVQQNELKNIYYSIFSNFDVKCFSIFLLLTFHTHHYVLVHATNKHLSFEQLLSAKHLTPIHALNQEI